MAGFIEIRNHWVTTFPDFARIIHKQRHSRTGIQRKYVPRSGQNRVSVRFADLFNDLDSRLRGNDILFWLNGQSGFNALGQRLPVAGLWRDGSHYC